MKDLIFILGVLLFIFIAFKLLFWALSHVITIAVVAALVYVVVRVMSGRKKSGTDA